MTQVSSGDSVRIHYTGRLNDGTVFDSSREREPLEFTIGQRQVIRGFEDGVIGMEPGESKTVEIPADQAYGPRLPEQIIEVDRAQMPPDMQLEIGTHVQGAQPGGQKTDFIVTALTESLVTLDANHPLAGKDLIFDLELVGIV